MNFKQVAKYLDDSLIFGIKPDLIRINKILELLDYPQKKIDFIQIVGTNGKTSTTKMTANILFHHRLKTAYHISPHINCYTERFWINGRNISEEKFTAVFNEIYPFIKVLNSSMDYGGPITQFEILTAMSYVIARNEGLGVMVQEAGMGGRWDATNAVFSKVVGFTGVSLEHTDILGGTIEEIAVEKAEVIKKGTLAATTSSDEKVRQILIRKSADADARLYIIGSHFDLGRKENLGLDGWKVDLKGIYGKYESLHLPLLGGYQPLNLSLSIVLSELYLETIGKRLENKNIKKALKSLQVEGRFEKLRDNPLVIADASHNPEGIKEFVKNMNNYFKGKRKIIIFAVFKDKNFTEMVKSIINTSDILILTSSLNARSLDLDILEREVSNIINSLRSSSGPFSAPSGSPLEEDKLPGEIYKINDIENSLKFALKISQSNDIICITGSIANLKNVKDLLC